MSGEFDGAPLVAGTVRGVRRFRVDELGRLRSPQQGTVWRPGDNEARCVRQDGVAVALHGLSVSIGGGYNVAVPAVKESKPLDRLGHSFASCRCGYYGFTDGHDAAEYGGPGTVTAVVEGWGDVMVGTRGFRAQYARVLAVHLPRSEAPRPTGAGDRYRPAWWKFGYPALYRWSARGKKDNLPGSQRAFTLALVLTFLLPTPLVLLGFLAAHVGPAGWIFFGAALFASFGFVVAGYSADEDAFDDLLEQKYSRPQIGVGSISISSMTALRSNYPGVRFYGSYAAMVAAFPPSPGEKPTPANTPDFWERP